MDDSDFNQILQLLESFTSPNNEIRFESEQRYQFLEQQSPEAVISILFRIINSNISINSAQQALIRIRMFLNNSLSSTPRITADMANNIKLFLLNYINESMNLILTNYALSIILEYFLQSTIDEKAVNEFCQFLFNLYQTKPLISLTSLTSLFNNFELPGLAKQIFSFMNLNPETETLFYQSIISGLILINHKIDFENFQGFISNLPAMLSLVPDDYLSEPLNTFQRVFMQTRSPFLPYINNFFFYLLETANNPIHEESIRVQCFYMFYTLVNYSKELRDVTISNPQIVMQVIANLVSQPHQFIDLYKEARKGLKYILISSFDNIDVFDRYIKELGLSENIYVQSIFLYHISTKFSLDFAFKNVFHEDQIIRKNCLRIIIKRINESSENGQNLKDLIEDKIVDIFVQYLNNMNFEIYKFFRTWCYCKGSPSFYKCIDPIIRLLNINYNNEKLLIMASLLYNLYPDHPDMMNVAMDLLVLAKRSIVDQSENVICVEIVTNIIPHLKTEVKIAYLNEILPMLFNSITLTVSIEFMSLIESIKEEFTPYLQTYLGVLFNIDDKIDLEKVNTNQIILNDSDLKNLSYMMQSLTIIFNNFKDFIQNTEYFFKRLIMIILKYLTFPFSEIKEEACMLCNNFILDFEKKYDVIPIFIEPFLNVIKDSNELRTLNFASSFMYHLDDISDSNPQYINYITSFVPLIFQQLMKIIEDSLNDDFYFDGDDNESVSEILSDLLDCYENMYDHNIGFAVSLFNEITKIVPYFTLPNLPIDIRCFIASVWVDLFAFAPESEYPNPPPDILNDLFQFFASSYGNKIRLEIINQIGTLAFYYLPQLAPSILPEFEKIISNENEDIDVRKGAILQYAALLLKCELTIFNSKISNFLQMIHVYDQNSQNISDYCVRLIQLTKYSNGNLDPQIALNVISSFDQLNLLSSDDISKIIKEIGDFQPLQSIVATYVQEEEEEEMNTE